MPDAEHVLDLDTAISMLRRGICKQSSSELKGWKRRAEDAETQVSSLRMPEGFAAIEHATLRTELAGAQARQDALQNEVEAEKEKRIAAEDTKKHLLSQHAALTEDNDRLKEN
ncbi:uncharacterized protein B0H18DRAFT_1113008 [Fomitopsis serialis]|uniref:uncharacterized protein n=1 Tax=Fomitopsis serialis TaxID=139415 RepID=UPI0020083943|nr:uncharacterized protein B0H18DRAFT_1113008 [Neoantrodia serialis]KAH9937134.1 hypothetical protein B0H18DRAFT_1113008 [Neoantrodia serialis]